MYMFTFTHATTAIYTMFCLLHLPIVEIILNFSPPGYCVFSVVFVSTVVSVTRFTYAIVAFYVEIYIIKQSIL